MLVFIDDSGDPGFKTDKGSSPVFVIALVIFKDNLEAEKTSLAIKELRRKLKVDDRYEFKFNKTDARFKKAFYNQVIPFGFKVRAIVVKKEVIKSPRLRNFKENFYNYIIMQVLKQSSGKIVNAKLKFDKRGERALRDELRVYLSKELNNKTKHIFEDLKFADSRQNTLIQLADMVAGSISHSYSKENSSYIDFLRKEGKVDDLWEFK